MAKTVLECVIRCESPADAEWVVKMLTSSIAEHSGIHLDTYGVFPEDVFDAPESPAEVDVIGAPA